MPDSAVSFGSATGPVVAALLIAGLWRGARASTLCLVVAHRVLAALNRTSHLSYMLAGGGVALAFALLMQTFGLAPGPATLGMDVFSGTGAGLFYRLFAGTQRHDD
jgi:hypothetical protein